MEDQVIKIIKKWKCRKAKIFANVLVNEWGVPSGISDTSVSWKFLQRKPYLEVLVKDEKHFVYTTIKSTKKITIANVCDCVNISENILVDRALQTVTARSTELKTNDVMCNFVFDVINKKVSPTKTEFTKRMNTMVTDEQFDLHAMI